MQFHELTKEQRDQVNKQAQDLVEKEVIYCVSSLVYSLLQSPEFREGDYADELYSLTQDSSGNEVYEHWIVSDYLASLLKAIGEAVVDDLYGLTVWGRCTTGQAIYMDYEIQVLAAHDLFGVDLPEPELEEEDEDEDDDLYKTFMGEE
jgi:hypothetical protein